MILLGNPAAEENHPGCRRGWGAGRGLLPPKTRGRRELPRL